jgi:hypothetical protein
MAATALPRTIRHGGGTPVETPAAKPAAADTEALYGRAHA